MAAASMACDSVIIDPYSHTKAFHCESPESVL